jgi:hypothetical protein
MGFIASIHPFISSTRVVQPYTIIVYIYHCLYCLTEITDGANQTVGYGYNEVDNRTALTETLAAIQYLPPGAYQENDGLVVIEVENFEAKTSGPTHKWLLKATQSGYTGTAYVQPRILTNFIEPAQLPIVRQSHIRLTLPRWVLTPSGCAAIPSMLRLTRSMWG